MIVRFLAAPTPMIRATALPSLPQATLGGESWGEGATRRINSTLWNCGAQPPHPTLSPIDAADGGEGLQAQLHCDGVRQKEFAHAQ